MSRLGAIFAGGQARRFGADKAAAELDGQALLEHVAGRLRPQADALVVVGRTWHGLPGIADLPRHGLGPLGALAGALAHAQANGHDEVLTSGCDLPDLPADLAGRLTPGPAVIEGQPLLGLWPARLAEPLLAYLAIEEDRSMRRWIVRSGTRTVPFDRPIANINTADELAAFVRLSADPRSSR